MRRSHRLNNGHMAYTDQPGKMKESFQTPALVSPQTVISSVGSGGPGSNNTIEIDPALQQIDLMGFLFGGGYE